MQYIYSKDCKKEFLKLDGELYKYIAKVRRHKVGDELKLRNLKDDILYTYKIVDINKKNIELVLKDFVIKKGAKSKRLELFWCIIDTKTIEKTLPFLNQIGVTKITFIYCQRSQKNFKIDLNRLQKIVINSNQQCGRVDLMEFDLAFSLKDVLKENDNLAVLDFGGDSDFKGNFEKVLIGCEGGFSDEERQMLKNYKKISFKTENILKSESAAVSIAAKLLL